MNDQHYLTSEGAVRLKAELEQLKGPGREEMAKRLRAAIQMGDLSENADYHKAKEDQGFLEGRIMELEYLLQHATIVAEIGNGDREIVEVGARVTVIEEGYPPETYFLVGAQEADPRNGKISNESPIGRALLGHRIGDQVAAETPNGIISLTITGLE
ncbi:MAG: transcription elongation factor GreA [Chloroflexi bacterium RBG_16_52_11]|nr:MAG: transcription elongation factor GreA [Chloroflexi bacterium RBG_16_52_11]